MEKFILRLKPETIVKIKELAKKEDRKVSAMARKIIEDALVKNK